MCKISRKISFILNDMSKSTTVIPKVNWEVRQALGNSTSYITISKFNQLLVLRPLGFTFLNGFLKNTRKSLNLAALIIKFKDIVKTNYLEVNWCQFTSFFRHRYTLEIHVWMPLQGQGRFKYYHIFICFPKHPYESFAKFLDIETNSFIYYVALYSMAN